MTRDYDRLTLSPRADGTVSFEINGCDLLDLVRDAERTHAAAEGDPRLAGAWRRLPIDLALPPSRRLLGDRGEPLGASWDEEAGKTPVLVCLCGEPGCSALLVRVEAREYKVTWCDFENTSRSWPYSLGPFVFRRREYERTLAEASETAGRQ